MTVLSGATRAPSSQKPWPSSASPACGPSTAGAGRRGQARAVVSEVGRRRHEATAWQQQGREVVAALGATCISRSTFASSSLASLSADSAASASIFSARSRSSSAAAAAAAGPLASPSAASAAAVVAAVNGSRFCGSGASAAAARSTASGGGGGGGDGGGGSGDGGCGAPAGDLVAADARPAIQVVPAGVHGGCCGGCSPAQSGR